MKRTHWNFLIDAAAFVLMLLLVSTGLVLAHQLPPGSGGEHGFGVGRGAGERPVALLWGWSRHQWGDFHYGIAYALLAVVAAHVLLHWKWIICVTSGKTSDASPYRLMVGAASLTFLVGLATLPLVTPTTSTTRSDLIDQPTASANAPTASEITRAPSVRGSMSVGEISRVAGMPLNDVLRKLKLPADTSGAERAGRLLRQHGLEMSDLRQAIGLPADDHDAGSQPE